KSSFGYAKRGTRICWPSFAGDSLDGHARLTKVGRKFATPSKETSRKQKKHCVRRKKYFVPPTGFTGSPSELSFFNGDERPESHSDRAAPAPLSKLTKVSDNSSGPDTPRGEPEVLKEEIDVPVSFSFLSRRRIVDRLLVPCVPGHRRQSG